MQDDGSGRQQWTFTRTANGYNIQVVNGRAGCNNYMQAQPCNVGTGLTFGGSGAAGQYTTWSVTAGTGMQQAAPAITPGQYQITSIGRSCANSYLGTALCSQSNQALMQNGGASSSTCMWVYKTGYMA